MASINNPGSAGSLSRSAPHALFGTPLRVLVSISLMFGLLMVVINAVAAQESNPSTPAAGTPEATPSAAMPRIELDIQEVNDSELGGTVTLYEFGDSTIVEFDATGAGGDHPAFIIGGTCEAPADEPLHELNPVDAQGKSTTVIDTSLDDLLAEDNAVSISMQADDLDSVIGCAMIEGEPSTDPAATPAASPQASPSATQPATPEADGVGGNTERVGGATDGTDGASDATAEATAETTGATDGTGGGVDADSLTINLVDWSDTGVTGTAVFTSSGDRTTVVVTLTGDAVVGDHALHIHNGTCTTPGSATYTLNPINASGTSTSTVNLSLDSLRTSAYFVNVHPNEANWDAWMVCGNITGTPTTVTSAPATTPTSTSVTTTTGDGTGGGNVTLTTTSAQAAAFPQTVGVGDGLVWPSDTRTAVIWGLSASIVVMTAAAVILRQGERSGKAPRFNRLGL